MTYLPPVSHPEEQHPGISALRLKSLFFSAVSCEAMNTMGQFAIGRVHIVNDLGICPGGMTARFVSKLRSNTRETAILFGLAITMGNATHEVAPHRAPWHHQLQVCGHHQTKIH